MLIPAGIVQGMDARTSNYSDSVDSGSGLFRTTITIGQPYDLTRLEKMGVKILAQGESEASLLATESQLESLARLGFEPQASMDLGLLVAANAESVPWLANSMKGYLEQSTSIARQSLEDPEAGVESNAKLLEIIQGLSVEQISALQALPGVDNDADGLTDTQESWWCTNPNDRDSDGDGRQDGAEIQVLKDWMANRLASAPGETPWSSWPFNSTTCPDKDNDSIPNLAERWELGLNMDLESTDRDKFDDGQEVFGVTNCPGGDNSCGYGDLPRSSDAGYVGQLMPSWVKAPGNHPLVTAHPTPNIYFIEPSLHMTTTTIVTTDHVIASGTTKDYSTSTTNGTSTGVSNTTTWNDWEEVSDTTPVQGPFGTSSINSNLSQSMVNYQSQSVYIEQPKAKINGFSLIDGLVSLAEAPGKIWNAGIQIGEGINEGIYLTAAYGAPWNWNGHLDEYDFDQAREQLNKCRNGQDCRDPVTGALLLDGGPYALGQQGNGADDQNYTSGIAGRQLKLNGNGGYGQNSFPINVSVSIPPVPTHTETNGRSWGGSQTNTTEQYEEHTVTNGESFSNDESWGTATAVDSAHAADLWFSYLVENTGTDYAREIANLAFNIYLNDDPNPITTYFVGPDLGADPVFRNFQPDETHTYTSRHIPLTLEQMKQIDLGGTIRIELEDFSFGADELFYNNAVNGNVQLAIEDGVEDGDESIDRFLIPAYAGDTVTDILGRYFPHAVDAEGGLVAIWTPEYRQDVPAWCAVPRVVGAGANQTVWCKHALTTADWWNIYTNNLGDGTMPLQETSAVAGATALFRFNADSDLDGYSDRSEVRLDTDPYDAGSYPQPELLAGVHSIRNGNNVISTLSLLNTGLYDAYGVEAVMIAPDDSITIANNTVGGSGRVRTGKEVVVGSRILSPVFTSTTWQGTAKPLSAGYYLGVTDKIYAFSVSCSLPAGCQVGSDAFSLIWNDGSGSNTLIIPATYQSPSLVSVGADGLMLSMLSGRVINGNTFTIEARTPRDTFQYTINSEPYTSPVVIVSYNDPQGNHRFVIPAAAMTLTSPTDDLLAFSGAMLDIRGVEIVTNEAFTPGANSTSLVVDNPSTATLENAHLFLEFIDSQGAVVEEVSATQNLPAGPSVADIAWDTANFVPVYDPEQDYIVMAFWTDYEGNILDVIGRPLSSFQEDPQAQFAMSAADASWDFGAVSQGTLLQRTFTFANTGERELLTYVEAPAGLSVSQIGSRTVGVADQTSYEIILNAQGLPVGAYSQVVNIHTSDPANAVRTVQVSGMITEGAADVATGDLERPLDYAVTVPGPQTQGTWYQFTHDLGPEPQTLHPVKVYGQDYGQLWGVGRYATQFNLGTFPPDMFGDGRDGTLVVQSGQTYLTDNQRSVVNGTAVANQPTVNYSPITGGVSSSYINYWPKYDWIDTNIQVTAGDRIVITKDEHGNGGLGKICYGANGTLCYMADGIDELAPAGWTGTGLRKYSLIGRIGNGSPFYVGKVFDGYANSSGTLYLGGNDCVGCFGDNTREWWFNHQISVYPSTNASFSSGDIALIIQMTGSNAGQYEIGKVISSGNGWVTFDKPLQHTYITSGYSTAQVIRVPQFLNVTVRTGGMITAHNWAGTTGAIIAFMVRDQFVVETGGTVSAFAIGFNGGRETAWSQPNSGPAYQGASYLGIPQITSLTANAGGGGGGQNDGGGGAGYSYAGQNGANGTGTAQGGGVYGDSNLSTILLGSGGGGSGHYYGDAAQGGKGGGAIIITAKSVTISGKIVADGQGGWQGGYGGSNAAPATPVESSRCGGGGSGGSIKLTINDGIFGQNNITALGGPGGKSLDGGGWGGNGSSGRIRVEYCDAVTGATNPNSLPIRINCFITEQIEADPYTSSRLNLPSPIAIDTTYAIQYGRKMQFTGASDLTSVLRVPGGLYTSATMDILISGVGSGNLTVSLDIGNDGSTDFTRTGIVTDSYALEDRQLAEAFNRWWAVNGRPTSGEMDVPVRVSLSKAGQVLLTDLKVNQSGSSLRQIQLESGNYSQVFLDYTLTGADGPITVGLDIGDDGTVDDVYTADLSVNPQDVTSLDLATVVNAYLADKTGMVNVPVRFHLPDGVSVQLRRFTANRNGSLDVGLTAADILLHATAPTEGAEVPVTVTLHNTGTLPSGSVVAAFFASNPSLGEWYIGSSLVSSVPAGGTAQTNVDWNTLGFTGDTTVRVVVDPYSRVAEIDENNNAAQANIYIRTRPDLEATTLTLSDSEPVLNEAITVSLIEANHGEADSSASHVSVYDGDPQAGGVLLGDSIVEVIGGSSASLNFTWTPTQTGWHRIFAFSDDFDQVSEYNEANNQKWMDVYVGFAGPLLLDSGTTTDPVYSATAGYGYLDINQPDVISSCGTNNLPEDTLRRDPDGRVLYRFDHLQPGHFYHLDVTFYECDGAGRQQTVSVDENLISGIEDLGDGLVHRLSLRLDPALYADRSITVAINAEGIDGAVIGAINLHDIDYRYADAGGGKDPQYPGNQEYGWLDGAAVLTWGTLPYRTVRVDQGDNAVRYQFDNLNPAKRYNVHFTFWQPSGTGRIQKVQVDGLDTGMNVNTGDYLLHQEKIAVPLSAYSTDGSVVISIVRTNATTGAMVNEIALEEETVITAGNCVVQATPYFSETYGTALIMDVNAPAGTVIQAVNPRGDTVGCFTVTNPGNYGFMRIYGEDPSAVPAIPGMRAGELVAYKVNGAPAVSSPLFYWSDDHAAHNVNLNAGNITGQSILLQPGWNLISFLVEPPAPIVSSVLQSINGRYDRVLGEYGVYVPSLPDPFNTMRELHSATGYYLRVTGSTSVSLLVDGIAQPCTSPKQLHAGWNWIGAPCAVTPTATALQNINGHYQRVLSLNRSYDPALPAFSTLTELRPGEGYLIYITDPVTLIYPEGTPLNVDEQSDPVDVCDSAAATPFATIVYGELQWFGQPVPAGSLVEFITPRGEVAGCNRIMDSGWLPLTHVFGADGQGATGFADGEPLYIRVNGVDLPQPLNITWQDDKMPHEIHDLITGPSIYLPVIIN